MRKIGIIADSTASLSQAYIEANHIGMVHFKYTLDGITCREGVDETTDQYHKRLRVSTDFPKTSQPALGDYLSLYKDYSQAYEEVLVLPLSKGLSGAYQTAVLAASDFENVRVLDTGNALDSTRFMIERIVGLIDEGRGADEIVQIIERDKAYPNYSALLVANDLKYLERGGRIPPAVGKVGDFLKLKPILDLNSNQDGKLGVTEISRGDKKTINKLVEKIPAGTKRVAIGDVNNKEIREVLVEKVKVARPEIEISDCTVTPVIASHIGPNCYGLFYSKI